MADTERSKAAVLALLPDNATGAISPQDMRDAVVSLAPCHGEIYVSSAAAQTLSNSQTYYALSAATTVLSDDDCCFDMPADGRLRYTGAPDKVMHIACTVSVTCASNNQELRMRLGKNGTSAAQSEVRFYKATGADIESTAMHWFIRMSQNDYIEMFVANWTSTASVTVSAANLFAMGMIV